MEVASIDVRRQHGVLVVQATGRTAKGQRYIKGSIPLTVKSARDPKFKAEMTAAVEELLGSSP